MLRFFSVCCAAGVLPYLAGCTFSDTTSNRDPMAFSQGLEPSPYVWYDTYCAPAVFAVPVHSVPVHSVPVHPVYAPYGWYR